LGVAWREVEPARDHAGIVDESELTFAGFAAFLDPPKESARPALEALSSLGVSVKIVTGDNERVTRHVCAALGIAVAGIINGPDLAQLSDEALSARLASTTLFCRVTPPQKARTFMPCAAEAMSSVISATGSMTRHRSRRPMSACRSRVRSTSPRKPPR
jgi:Mg2+-importing ATPase